MAYQSGAAFEELACFVAVVEAGGFTAAARRSGGRKATLSRRVQELEARLGVKLLARTTRSLRLTEEGHAYFEHASRAVLAAKDAEAAVERRVAAPSGMLRISTTAGLAGMVLEDVLAAFLRKYPAVSVDLDLSPHTVDLVRDGFDLALRIGDLPDSALVARRLGVGRGGYYASPGYLRERGEPKSVADLANHDLLAIPRGAGPTEWPFVVGGKRTSVVIQPRLRTTSFELAVRAAVAGLGIVLTPEHFALEHLRRRRLVPVLARWTQAGVDVHAVTSPGGMRAPKTRLFVEMLVAHFAKIERAAPGSGKVASPEL